MSILLAVPEREQSLGEEIANSISHGIGLVAALIATPFLIMRAVQYADTGFIIGASFFAATMILLYLASTLYHALPQGKAKRVFKIIEHSAIYLLIAGTYTPFTLGVLRGPWGWTLFGIVWGLAAIGVTLKAFDKMHNPIITTSLYLLMGWLILIAIYPLYTRIPVSGLLWLIAGGVTYTIGVFFFATDSRFRYGHFIWHLFVMVGTVCHYFAVLWYAAP
ncbi:MULTISPECIES: PAQR family membrane homeostasis protein TrhA [Nitrosomonas]|uniref:Hemolysin III n=3 Tax=Nitrosomonas eutropha TaxID=916 RepID=A0ABX5MCN4_9PROT|nr:hemolysin III family protein [Nitrosomonas eutropha]ABI58763.1 channel protein, hemolysin III family protein [Nitrosomonas eutropha C91]PXV81194.1 hemolysin III [Nitrosomonas eutropha]SCX02907.1 hemolysin III [Nitrosomonas eutropha]SDW23786.1 hemolysin III [Nitrosomonas eutropha]